MAARWHDCDECVEVEINNNLKGLGGSTIAQAVVQRIMPTAILSMERDQPGDGVVPTLRSGPSVRRPTVTDLGERLLGLAASAISSLSFGVAESVFDIGLATETVQNVAVLLALIDRAASAEYLGALVVVGADRDPTRADLANNIRTLSSICRPPLGRPFRPCCPMVSVSSRNRRARNLKLQPRLKILNGGELFDCPPRLSVVSLVGGRRWRWISKPKEVADAISRPGHRN
jgi:hypothetical protein